MTTDQPDWWSILRALDEPVERLAGDGLEVPRDFDLAATQGRFNRLAELLSEAFGCECSPGHPQDSACFGGISIPAAHTRSRTKRTRIPLPLVVEVSSFGGLATYRPIMRWFDQIPSIHRDDRELIETALGRLGYLVVPEDILAEPYDGPNTWVFGPTYDTTWYTRFFDYL